MAKSRAKLGVALVAAILVGAGVFAFVAYTTFDAIGFGKVVELEEHATTLHANETILATFSPESEPVVTIWTGATGATFNGTVNAAKVSNQGKVVYIFDTAATFTAYPPDTTYLKFNYTGQGSMARSVTQPAIILVAVFAIVVVAAVMVSSTGNLGGKKGGRKSFP